MYRTRSGKILQVFLNIYEKQDMIRVRAVKTLGRL